MPTFVTSPSLTKSNLIAPKAEVMTMDKLKRMSRERASSKTSPTVTETEQSPAPNEMTETLPKALKEKLHSKKNITVFNAEGFLTTELLNIAGVKHKEHKNYMISHVLDEEKEQYVSLKRAKRIGILNLRSNEFIDPRSGKATDIITAIQTNKIKVSEFRTPSASLNTSLSGSRRPSTSTEIEETLINDPFPVRIEPAESMSPEGSKQMEQASLVEVLSQYPAQEKAEELMKGSDMSFNVAPIDVSGNL